MLPVYKRVPYDLLRSVRVYLRVLQKVGFPKIFQPKKYCLQANHLPTKFVKNLQSGSGNLQLKFTNAILVGGFNPFEKY